jgi:hypothetical protein
MKATIRRDSPRYSTWLDIFGTDTISILDPPKVGPQGQLRILVDVGALNPNQKKRLAVKFSKAWRMPADRVMHEIEVSGSVPISAEDVDVMEEAARLF